MAFWECSMCLHLLIIAKLPKLLNLHWIIIAHFITFNAEKIVCSLLISIVWIIQRYQVFNSFLISAFKLKEEWVHCQDSAIRNLFILLFALQLFRPFGAWIFSHDFAIETELWEVSRQKEMDEILIDSFESASCFMGLLTPKINEQKE